MALTESREMETQMRWKAGGFNERRVVYPPRLEERPSPTEDAIAQKQIGEPDYMGAYNVGKCNGGMPSVVDLSTSATATPYCKAIHLEGDQPLKIRLGL